MSKERLTTRVELTCFVHATEDESRVLQALRNLLPEDLKGEEQTSLRKTLSYGFYGNPILLLHLEFEGVKAEKVALNLFASMSREDLLHLLDSFYDRLDKGRLYLRFDKQEAYYGNLKLSGGDEVIRCVIKLKPHLHDRESFRRALREYGVEF